MQQLALYSASDKLKECLKKVKEILQEIETRKEFNTQEGQITLPPRMLKVILDKLTVILGLKIIDDDIHSVLFLERNKISEIYNSIHNNIITEPQSAKLEKILSQLVEDISIEINRLR